MRIKFSTIFLHVILSCDASTVFSQIFGFYHIFFRLYVRMFISVLFSSNVHFCECLHFVSWNQHILLWNGFFLCIHFFSVNGISYRSKMTVFLKCCVHFSLPEGNTFSGQLKCSISSTAELSEGIYCTRRKNKL